MRGRVDEIRQLGAELVVVGNGQPFHAQAFRQDHAIDFPLLVDPEMVAYAAAGLRRGPRTVLALGVLQSAVRAMRGGHRQGRAKGDTWQQGGAFVIMPDGSVRYVYVSQEAGDHADPDEILAVLRREKEPQVRC